MKEQNQAETKAMTMQEKNITDMVLNRVNSLAKAGELTLPANYSVENAMKSAYLILQEVTDKEKNPALAVCTKASITNALLDMAIQGLNPVKKQCYFVVYGKQLQLMRSYMGTIAVAKRVGHIGKPVANCIYQDDKFEYEINLTTGLKKITKHNQNFENVDLTKIKGAYAIIPMPEGDPVVEVMNIAQIKKAWAQGVAYSSGKSTAHNNFTDEMCKKTVVNRACKLIINTSDDSDLLVETFNSADDEVEPQRENVVPDVEYEINEEVAEKANSVPLDIPPEASENAAQHGEQLSMNESSSVGKGPDF